MYIVSESFFFSFFNFYKTPLWFLNFLENSKNGIPDVPLELEASKSLIPLSIFAGPAAFPAFLYLLDL